MNNNNNNVAGTTGETPALTAADFWTKVEAYKKAETLEKTPETLRELETLEKEIYSIKFDTAEDIAHFEKGLSSQSELKFLKVANLKGFCDQIKKAVTELNAMAEKDFLTLFFDKSKDGAFSKKFSCQFFSFVMLKGAGALSDAWRVYNGRESTNLWQKAPAFVLATLNAAPKEKATKLAEKAETLASIPALYVSQVFASYSAAEQKGLLEIGHFTEEGVYIRN